MPSLQHLLVLLLVSTSASSIEEDSGGGILKTFLDYETTIFEAAQANNVSRVQSVSVVESDNNKIPYCHFAFTMPYSGFRPDRIPLQNGVFQGMAAVMLAIEHLNTGNGTLVKQLDGLDETCPMKFSAEFFDTGLSQIEAVDQIIQIMSRGNTEVVDDEDTSWTGPTSKLLPSAYIGAARSAVSIPTSIITGLGGYPQISPMSTSTQLEDTSQFPLFGRTVPSDAGTAIPAILYLHQVLGVKHLAVLHVNDSYGNAYALGLQLAAAEYAPEMVIQSYDFPFEATPEIISKTVSLLKQTQFRYFFGIFFSTVHYDPIMTEAYHQGIAGTGDHNWIFSDSVSTSVFADGFEVGSPLHFASRGSSRIGAVGGVPGIPKYDLFLHSMMDLDNPHDIDLIQSRHPTYPKEPDYEPYQIEQDNDFFGKATAAVVPFLFDAVIALGLASCQLASTASGNNNTYFSGQEHFDTYKTMNFDGATGSNIYDSDTGSRIAESARFTLLNFVEDGIIEDENDADADNMATSKQMMKIKTVETDLFQDGQWTQVQPHIFNDGSTTPSPDLPPLDIENNYLGTALRAVGLSMTILIVTLSFASSLWTQINGRYRVVRASQPIFLHLITFGCALMGSSILFLSLDDEVVSTQVCTSFCISFPWFLCFGWICVFSALFAKTRRVNKIFHNPNTLKRIKVTVWDVMASVLCLMTLATVVLTLWTILQPPTWNREVSSFDPFGREFETKGSCNYEDGIAFVVTLGVLLLGILVYAVYEAYVARNVSTEFAESEYIAVLLATILLVSFLGIPVMIIAGDEPRARFFVSAAIIFIICMATLLLIFVPKIYANKWSQERASIEFKGDPSQNLRANNGQVGSRPRISVSGLVWNNASAVSSTGSDREGKDDSTSDGIEVLHHPKEIDEMRQQISDLQTQNKTLISQVSRMRSLHTKTQSRLNLVQSLEGERSLSLKAVLATAAVEESPADEECVKLVSAESEDPRNITETSRTSSAVSIDMAGEMQGGSL